MTRVLSTLTLLLALSACGAPSAGPQTPVPTPPVLAFPDPSPVGTPVGPVTEAVIGAAGGTLSSPDGAVTVEIPSGALASDQTVGIQEVTTTSPARFGRSFRLTPEGTTFARPVRVRFRYDAAQLRGTTLDAQRIHFQTPEGYWTPAPVQHIDAEASAVTVETTHFSIWASLPDAVLFPQLAEVKVGQSVTLEAVMCDELPEDFENPYAYPVTACEVSPVLGQLARNWSVNGVPGGHAGIGTVASSVPGQAVYTAPGKVPSPNPVTVSMQYNSGTNQVTLISEVKVLEPAAQYRGTITYTETGQQAWEMRDGFQGSGLEFAKQTHTFTVVGEKSADQYNTILVLEQEGAAEYSDIGHMEKKIYEICEAFGPTILRHHFTYDRNFKMSGTVKATLEARLHIADGQYSLSFIPQDVPVTGQDTTTDLYKDGCAGTTNDRSNSKPVKTIEGPQTTDVSGPLDPAQPDTLAGQLEGRGSVFIQPTQYRLSWNLTRTR